jgi:hypothetical protein
MSQSQSQSQSFKKLIFLKYIRNVREANFLFRTSSEEIFEEKLPFRYRRDTENNENNENDIIENTSLLPLENNPTTNVYVDFSSKVTNENADILMTTDNIVTTEETVIPLENDDYDILTTAYPEDLITENQFNISSLLLSDDKRIDASTVSSKLNLDEEILSDQSTTFLYNLDSSDISSHETSTEITSNDYYSSVTLVNNLTTVPNIDNFSTTTKTVPNDEATDKAIYDQDNIISKIIPESMKATDLGTDNTLNVIKNENYKNNESKNIMIINRYQTTTNSSKNDILISEDIKPKNSMNLRSLSPELNENYNYFIYGHSSIPCILASMNIILEISYDTSTTNVSILLKHLTFVHVYIIHSLFL